MSRKPTIGTLIEREARGEDLQLRPGDQEVFAVTKEGLKFLAANDDPLSHFLINLIWVNALPTCGRKRKSAELLKEEADALAWGREQIEELRKDSTVYIPSVAARQRAAEKVLKKFPKLGKRWFLGTVMDGLKRRKRFAQR